MGFLIRREGTKHIIKSMVLINLSKNKRKQVKSINTIMVSTPYITQNDKNEKNTRMRHVNECNK